MIDPKAISFLESDSVECFGGPSVDDLTKIVCVCIFGIFHFNLHLTSIQPPIILTTHYHSST